MRQPTETPATAVFDKGRRGNPLPGCDCVQCFGYCLIDGGEVLRERIEAEERRYKFDWREP